MLVLLINYQESRVILEDFLNFFDFFYSVLFHLPPNDYTVGSKYSFIPSKALLRYLRCLLELTVSLNKIMSANTVKASNFVILLGENIFCGKLS
jgi:hypothetical protein